jgi:hypothetical protein
MSREMLVGAVVGWCAGWAARTDQNRAWHHGLRHQLEGPASSLMSCAPSSPRPWISSSAPRPITSSPPRDHPNTDAESAGGADDPGRPDTAGATPTRPWGPFPPLPMSR